MRHQRQCDPESARRPSGHHLSAMVRRGNRKLRFSGTVDDRDRLLSLLNNGLFGYTASSDGWGNISILANKTVGPPLPEQMAFHRRLVRVLADCQPVSIGIESGGLSPVGSFVAGTLDLADIERLGSGAGISVRSALIFFIEAQYRRQISGQKLAAAHVAALMAETEQSVAIRGIERVLTIRGNDDGTIDARVEIPCIRADGNVQTLTLMVSHSNLVHVSCG